MYSLPKKWSKLLFAVIPFRPLLLYSEAFIQIMPLLAGAEIKFVICLQMKEKETEAKLRKLTFNQNF